MIEKIKAAAARAAAAIQRGAKWVWCHRTKTLATFAGGIAYAQNHLAQLGKILSPELQGSILGGFAVVLFALGFYNTFASKDPPADPPTA